MIYIYILYVILSAVILVLISNRNYKEWLLKMLIVSFMPIIGWFLPIIWPKKMIQNKGETLEDYLHQQNEDISIEILDTKENIEKEKELNIIPIEEALVVSDFSTRRKVMLDVLKKDTLQYMDVIKTAVLNEDTETSHFAVTAVLEEKRKISYSLQTFSVEFEKYPQDINVAKAYAQVLKEYMRSGFLDEQTLKKNKYLYIQVLQRLLDNGLEDQHTFEGKIKAEMEIHEYSAAETTALQYLQKYPESEDPYICLLNFYYTTKSKSKIQHTLDELMNSQIKFSNRALTIVRYWTGGDKYATKS